MRARLLCLATWLTGLHPIASARRIQDGTWSHLRGAASLAKRQVWGQKGLVPAPTRVAEGAPTCPPCMLGRPASPTLCAMPPLASLCLPSLRAPPHVGQARQARHRAPRHPGLRGAHVCHPDGALRREVALLAEPSPGVHARACVIGSLPPLRSHAPSWALRDGAAS